MPNDLSSQNYATVEAFCLKLCLEVVCHVVSGHHYLGLEAVVGHCYLCRQGHVVLGVEDLLDLFLTSAALP